MRGEGRGAIIEHNPYRALGIQPLFSVLRNPNPSRFLILDSTKTKQIQL